MNKEFLGDIKSTKGRTNILLLGIPGGHHAGKDLTDTLIFFSIDRRSGASLMLSLPRDIWIDSMKAKINTAYHYGEEKKVGGGLSLVKKVVSEVTGQPIHYAVLLDFSGFVKAIDALGGVEVEVKEGFTDNRYPLPGKENDNCHGDSTYQCRYERLHFEAGWQHMDGERALKYARSRYSVGDEGTDFARSRRQQRVLLAVRRKIFSWNTLRHPSNFWQLYQILKSSVKTDIRPQDYAGLVKLALKFDPSRLRTEVLDFLTHPSSSTKYEGQWVLVPQKNWQIVHRRVFCFLDEGQCANQ